MRIYDCRIYTTMTRQKVLRLTARGWRLTPALHDAIYVKKSRWAEVCRTACGLLDGVAYDPYL